MEGWEYLSLGIRGNLLFKYMYIYMCIFKYMYVHDNVRKIKNIYKIQ